MPPPAVRLARPAGAARTFPPGAPPPGGPGRLVLGVVLTLLVLLALPIRSFGGSTLAQAAPAQGQEYVVKAGDTLASIAAQADPAHAGSLTGQLAREVGSTAVVPGEHIFIP